LPTLFLAVVLGIVWWFRNGGLKPIFMALGCFVATLLPVLGFIDHYFLRFSHVGDHFQYLASMAPLTLVGALLVKLMDLIPKRLRLIGYIFPSMLLLALLSRTWSRVPVFFDDLSLWSETIELNPNAWLAQSNLGFDLIKRGQPSAAIENLQKSIELNPHQEWTYYNLGIAYSSLEDYEQAIRYFKLAIEEYPDTLMFHNNLGAALRRTGRQAEARCSQGSRSADTSHESK